MFILDTNTISEIRKSKMRRADPGVAAWAAGVDIELQYLSVMTLQELEMGTLRAERKDPRKGAVLRAWLTQQIQHVFLGRILSVDPAVALRSGHLHAQRSRPLVDALIAASAYVHGMTVVTRNVSDFEDAGIDVLNPWSEKSVNL